MGWRRRFGRVAAGLAVVGVALAAPIAWTETMCRGEAVPQREAVHITDPADRRAEARTFLTYPEWHIVYAYEDQAEALASGDNHDVRFLPAIAGFWTSLCALRKRADALGDPGEGTMATIYTIGVSFTLEMALKGLYEESLGRLFAAIRGDAKTPQDRVEAEMAADYAAFLHQVPWYRYDFSAWRARLWDAAAADGFSDRLRSWERRLALGVEWSAKSAYAQAIAAAVGTMAPDELTMKVFVRPRDSQDLEGIGDLPHARVLEETADGTLLEVDRYRVFTDTVREIARMGGEFVEIAGNDDILVSATGEVTEVSHGPGQAGMPDDTAIIAELARFGQANTRYLIVARVSALDDLLEALARQPVEIEHIHDY